ncbi:hypothetical protein AERO8C_120489 [Aeromonas veronii]|uniref:Uncharacterized protein n=1 Tax=Aeromonas veronii TaxID=654 RepID=A0A653KRN5_AERVE|nr:hypothetical protein AERO8C_120489 [Aeromonas veronii]
MFAIEGRGQRLLGDLHLVGGMQRDAEHGEAQEQVDGPQRRPDQTQLEGGGLEVEPQYSDAGGATERQQQVHQVILETLVAAQLHIEVGNHRQVDEGEGHEGAKVDQRQRHLQIQRHRREGQ